MASFVAHGGIVWFHPGRLRCNAPRALRRAASWSHTRRHRGRPFRADFHSQRDNGPQGRRTALTRSNCAWGEGH